MNPTSLPRDEDDKGQFYEVSIWDILGGQIFGCIFTFIGILLLIGVLWLSKQLQLF
jgi:hypothetical protein